MASLWIGIVLLTLVRNTISEFDPSVCSIIEESYGLVPPPLPRNFEMKSEVVDHKGNYTAYEEMYFDYTNSRAKFKHLTKSIEYNYLFDYSTEQVVQWIKVHPGTSMKRDPLSHSCEAVNMEESPFAYIFGYQDWIYLRSKMFNSNQVLRYGGQYLYAANGTKRLDERGLNVNKFIGCIYDDSVNATLLNDYYFADTSNLNPSGGTPSSIITGSDGERPLSVPIKLHLNGRRYVKEKQIPIEKTYSISWFKGEPQFKTENFQIPPWIHCENYRGSKDIPKFPKAFSTRVTIASFRIDILGQLQKESSSESYEVIFYDSERKLARRDFTPTLIDTEIFSRFGSYTPVSVIYDFNEGLRYTINKPSGSCYIYPILENEYFDAEEDLTYRKLATPEEIFLMQMDDMQYKGKAFTRDIECDVWNGKHTHKQYNATFVKESYFSTNGWHELTDGMVEYNVPVKNVVIRKEVDGEVAEGISTYNFLKFKGKAPKMPVFDIKGCVEQIDHKRFAIELAVDEAFSETVYKYRSQFLEAAQLYIASKTELNTPLRVQRVYVRPQSISNGRVFLVFSLLEKANLKDLPIVVGQTGVDLPEAIVLLQKLVDSGKFSVQFTNPTNKDEIIAVLAERGSLYTLMPSGNFTKAPLVPAKLKEFDKQQGSGEEKAVTVVVEVEEEVEEHAGMTSGHLALLAVSMIVIGIGIGIAVMYLYIRYYNERHTEDRIKMTSTGGPSMGEASELNI